MKKSSSRPQSAALQPRCRTQHAPFHSSSFESTGYRISSLSKMTSSPENRLVRSNSRPQTAIRKIGTRRRPQTAISTRSSRNNIYPKRSPFLVDLVAENERIDEENRVRRYRQTRKLKELEWKREEAKNAIILRALQEANELDALRREKRKILEEEKRLKAMIEIEKLNAQRKEDRIKAERAERKRKIDKTSVRVELNKTIINDKAKAEQSILRIKLNIEDPPNINFR
jgi:hypothetical protein